MPDLDHEPAQLELVGSLHWNEFEGGFWSLKLDESHPEVGDRAVLVGLGELDAPRLGDGMRIAATGTPRPEQIDFLMAGTRFEVASLREVTS